MLTHKGRSSSSGHYVAWTRRKGDDWLMFDDDDVTMVKSEDILKLSGGGKGPQGRSKVALIFFSDCVHVCSRRSLGQSLECSDYALFLACN